MDEGDGIPPLPPDSFWNAGDPPDLSAWVEENVWHALHVFMRDAYVVVNGEEISAILFTGDREITKKVLLRDALLWEVVDIIDQTTGKIDHPDDIELCDDLPDQREEYAAIITRIRQTRRVLSEVILEIDAALPREE